MSNALRETRRQETRRTLLAAAEKLFAERGLSEARVEDIADKAGVAVGTIYNHFDDREDLLKDLLRERREELEERLEDVLESTRLRNPAAQVEELAKVVFLHFEEHRHFLQVALEIEHQRTMQALRARSRQSTSMRAVYEAAQKLVERAFPGADELWPAFLTGIIRGALIRDLHEPGRSAADKAKVVASFFVHGVAR